MGFRGQGGFGMGIWDGRFGLGIFLKILTLQTADPQGKQNICARIRAMLTRFRVCYDI